MKIVTIGGGSGTFQMLKGIKDHDVTAIVSMADDGGSSGILRDQYGILPPGDVRKSLIALSECPKNMREIFSYRFSNGGLKNHNLGNLIITALTDITGSEADAIKEAAKILNVKGKVLPVTIDDSRIHAELEDGQIIKGETHIDVPKHNPELKIKNLTLVPKAKAYQDSTNAISEADLIIIGPGDLYTSILPNIIVDDIAEAIKNSNAKKAFICNLMTKYGETNNFKASDFLRELEKYLGENIIDFFIINNKSPSKQMLKKYKEENSIIVKNDLGKTLKPQIIQANLLNESDIIRHDAKKLSVIIDNLLN